MFNCVSVKNKSSHAHNQSPTQHDCTQVLSLINQGRFYMRELPSCNIMKYIKLINNDHIKQNLRPSCHSVANALQDQFQVLDLKRVSGYLIRNQMTKNKELQPTTFPPHFEYNSNTGNYDVLLLHHSVVIDGRGIFLECIPNSYPISDFIFVEHDSGYKGYYLKVS